MITIVLDPGHGGWTRVRGSSPNNATGPAGTLEKNLTLQLAQAVRHHASNYANVVLTRENDSNLGLADRAAVSRIYLADIFISIHFNGFNDPSVQGTECFHHTLGSQKSIDFSKILQSHVQRVTGYRDRGWKPGNFGVLRTERHNTDTAACLLEVSFLSNPADEARLQNGAYIDEIARAISESCRAYLADRYRDLLGPGILTTAQEYDVAKLELEDASDLVLDRQSKRLINPDLPISLGANWPEGKDDNPWYSKSNLPPRTEGGVQASAPRARLHSPPSQPYPNLSEFGLSALSYDIDPKEKPLNELIGEKYTSLDAMALHKMSPVEIGRSYLQTMMDDREIALVSMPKNTVGATQDRVSFKELKSEFDPLTEVHFVKFRQLIDKVPVYGSFVSMAVDEDRNILNFNSTLKRDPGNKIMALVSSGQAFEIIRPLVALTTTPTVPELNYFYNDTLQNWHLVYMFKDMMMARGDRPIQSEPTNEQNGDHEHSHGTDNSPVIMDVLVDALTGEIIEMLSRVETAIFSTKESGVDGLGRLRDINVAFDDTQPSLKWMNDLELNLHTCDYHFADLKWDYIQYPLPGPYCEMKEEESDFSEAAIAAHANTARVLRFFKTELKRNGIDGNGGAVISTINCVRGSQNDSRIWPNAARLPTQMVYGQDLIDGKLRSYAESQDVVAHELLHGVIAKTSRLKYEGETGALNESYADIFGIIISNTEKTALDQWNWELGEELSRSRLALRDFSNPGRLGQPSHYSNFVHTNDDHKGVHTNSGIHNKAAYNVMTHRFGGGDYTFLIREFTILFYLTVTQQLSRTSNFVDSLHGMLRIANILFRGNSETERKAKRQAIIQAYEAAGITDPKHQVVRSSNGVPRPPEQAASGANNHGGRKSASNSRSKLNGQDVSLVKGIGPTTSKELANAGITNLNMLSELSQTDIAAVSEVIGVSSKRLHGWVESAKAMIR